ncbi:hypothetical protein GALMADRAFT_255157 [Galerina marginata CBS 339.88]|uniref:Uncharacterized protein n=1 Tax=Galerina marginata (strain CBS 339.88) TaxID=685588 RepID=A0A067SJQ3_GALM3|nr:hypothetical protein GALMADRAFT_255157 [Galerina marginata CBS 339.88]
MLHVPLPPPTSLTTCSSPPQLPTPVAVPVLIPSDQLANERATGYMARPTRTSKTTTGTAAYVHW